MDSNLILYDIDHFLDKYTRFMTKDIYISSKTYQMFLEQYRYLYQILKKNHFLYSDNPKYKKLMDIEKKQYQLVRLHNKKYLQGAMKRFQSFFENADIGSELNVRTKSIILSEEEKMLVIQDKNVQSLIVGKIKFLFSKYNYLDNQLLVLTDDIKKKNILLEEFQKSNINVPIKTIVEYGEALLGDEEQVLNSDKKYFLFSKLFVEKLFQKKSIFKKVYSAFSKYIYLNKDYNDYDTFKDYHSYMYKRKYLSSGSSLKKFNEQEIKKRRTFLRTIKNEIMKKKEEVDIANFLYLNSIPYYYQDDTSTFFVCLDEKRNKIQFFSKKASLEINNTLVDETIYLYSSYTDKKSFLEVLAYELIKRRYPLELVNEDILYNQLKDTSIYNYFSEFIRNYLIPTIDYYEKYGSLENTRLNMEQKEVIMDLYLMYDNEIEKNHYVREQDLIFRIQTDVLEKNYHYLFILGDIPFDLKIPTMTVVTENQEVQLLEKNIKLLYDYKKYLYENQKIPIAHVLIDHQELSTLTTTFLRKNLDIINKVLEDNQKEILVQYYNDFNRLHVYQNISICCDNLLKNNNKNILLGFTNLGDMKLLISSGLFSKFDKNTLFIQSREKIPCEEILKISKLYDMIMIPYLIKDSYHDDFLRMDYDYHIKVMLYIALSKCRKKLILLCPESKKYELRDILKSLNKKVITE